MFLTDIIKLGDQLSFVQKFKEIKLKAAAMEIKTFHGLCDI